MRSFKKNPLPSLLMIMAALLLCWGGIARGAEVVVVVSVNSPITTLSRIELINIFLGKTTYFPNGLRAYPIDQHVRSDSLEAFYLLYANKSAAQIKAYWSKMIFTGRGQPPKFLDNDEAIKQWVASNPNAIGYLDKRVVDETLRIVRVH